MIYYKYIFYRTYLFFFKMNSQDIPAFKAILLVGFLLLFNIVLVVTMAAHLANYDSRLLAGTRFFKSLIVSLLLGFWLVNYFLFWRGNKLPLLVQGFTDRTTRFNQPLATSITYAFFLLPIFLFLFFAWQGAAAYRLHR